VDLRRLSFAYAADVGRTTGRNRWIGQLAGIAVILACAAPAHAATQVGEPVEPVLNCTSDLTWLQTTSQDDRYKIPFDGVITSWSFRAGGAIPPQLRLKVGRVAGGVMTITGESAFATPLANTLNSFSTRISARSGDVIGFYIPSGGPLCVGPQSGSFEVAGGDVHAGQSEPVASGNVGYLDVAALLEPDCDVDGFGDETQDDDIRACPPGPNATITSAPKDKVKTKKKRKNATYTFSANEQGATFNCVLDGKQEFKACASPLTVSVKKGKHTFSVTATDPGGNTGAAATDTFKVKRKKKKKKK
jgi:hypothetical protein